MSDESSFFSFKEKTEIEFEKLYGFTFVFLKRTLVINARLSSAEIYPAGIIYEENDEYYFAPLDEVENMDEIAEEFVKKYMS